MTEPYQQRPGEERIPPQTYSQPTPQPGGFIQGAPQAHEQGYQLQSPRYQHYEQYQQPAPPHNVPEPPAPPQQHYSAEELPQRPKEISTIITLNYIMGIGMGIFGLMILIGGIATGGTWWLMALLAFIIGGLGLLNLLGAWSLNHKYFPNIEASQSAPIFIVFVCGVNTIRSFINGGWDIIPGIGTLLLIALAGAVLYLARKPEIAQWIRAKHELSIRQGHIPTNARHS